VTTLSSSSGSGTDRQPATISVVVPVLNEARSIVSFLQSVRDACDHATEIIVVDGGSNDDTPLLAAAHCDHVAVSAKGRAVQMNVGAMAASGTILCFLHADSLLPPHAGDLMRDALARATSGWGRFDVRLSGRHPMLRVVERFMNWRSNLTGIATGDQAMFMTRTAFEKVSRYPEIALMEDIAMSRKLKSCGAPACLPGPVVTSSRRWEENGMLRTILLMWKLRLLYFLGADPSHLAKRYYGHGV
jgi:rSAM/selenodomain-associated transferase 2